MREVSDSSRCLGRRISALCALAGLIGTPLTHATARAASAELSWDQRALNARNLAIAADATLGADTALFLAQALGGTGARQQLLTVLGHTSAALDTPAVAEPQWTRVADLARRHGDTAAELAALTEAGQAALALGGYERSLALATRQRTLARASGNLSAEAQAESVMGVIERRLGHLNRALQHQQRALALFQSDRNTIGAMRVLSDIGTIWRDRGDFARALDAHLEALAARERSGDRVENAYRNVALLYREVDASAARDYFQRALVAAERRAVPSAYASVVGSYASLLNDLGEFAAARNAADTALAIDTALNDRPHQGFEHLEIGRALLGERDITAATTHLEEALRLGRELGQREIVARALLHLTEIAMERRDRLLARGLLDEAIAGLERARLRPQLVQAYALREQLARAERDDATALRFARKHSAAREELIGIRASRQLAALEADHAQANAQAQLALLTKDNELQATRLDKQALQRRFGSAALAGLALLLLALLWRHLGVRRLNHALSARNEEIERHRAALGEANAKLGRQAADLYQAATTDWLTGVANRRELLTRLEGRIADCQREQRDLALLLIDFDHFKQINDLHGHLFGDRVLVAGVKAMRVCLDNDDVLGRFGGEEFVAIACDRTPVAVMQLAERLRAEVAEQLGAMTPELRAIATVSIGVAFLVGASMPSRPEFLLEAADRALYEAKSDGRNRVRRAA